MSSALLIKSLACITRLILLRVHPRRRMVLQMVGSLASTAARCTACAGVHRGIFLDLPTGIPWGCPLPDSQDDSKVRAVEAEAIQDLFCCTG